MKFFAIVIAVLALTAEHEKVDALKVTSYESTYGMAGQREIANDYISPKGTRYISYGYRYGRN